MIVPFKNLRKKGFLRNIVSNICACVIGIEKHILLNNNVLFIEPLVKNFIIIIIINVFVTSIFVVNVFVINVFFIIFLKVYLSVITITIVASEFDGGNPANIDLPASLSSLLAEVLRSAA